MSKVEATGFYEDVEHLKKLCDFLRSKHGPPIREATLMERRVNYIKGKQCLSYMPLVSLSFSLWIGNR